MSIDSLRKRRLALALLILYSQIINAIEQRSTSHGAALGQSMTNEFHSEEPDVAVEHASTDTWTDDRFYIAPFGTYLHSGGGRRAYDGWGGGIAIGKIVSRHFNIELRGFWVNYGTDNNGRYPDRARYAGQMGGHADLTGGSVDLQYHFIRELNWPLSPYIVASVGGVNTSYRTAEGSGFSDRAFLFQFGIGTTWEIADFLLVRTDVRYQLQDNRRHRVYNQEDPLNDLIANFGFVIPIGEKPLP
jgi:OmpA-OmpF porin, OOP family